MKKIALLFLVGIVNVACVGLPSVYLVDRHTVMESEASGEWPELEKRFATQALSAGPVPFEKDPIEKPPKAHLFLNSELLNESETVAGN